MSNMLIDGFKQWLQDNDLKSINAERETHVVTCLGAYYASLLMHEKPQDVWSEQILLSADPMMTQYCIDILGHLKLSDFTKNPVVLERQAVIDSFMVNLMALRATFD